MDRIRYLIGLATLAAAGVLGFVLFQLLADENPDGYFPIRLEFADVRGLGPGAEVRYRGVRVGSVREIGLSPDGEKGVVTVLLEAEHAELARVSSMFLATCWVMVEPPCMPPEPLILFLAVLMPPRAMPA